jgi:hypothetical protein
VATGLVAVLFQPLRAWLQREVNRLLYGQRDEPYTVITRLSQRLEGTLAPDAVLSTIVDTVAQALKLPYVAILLKQEDTFQLAASAGELVGDPLILPLVYQKDTIGQMRLAPRTLGEPFTPADRRLLDELARQAGLAAHAVQLTADLQRAYEHLEQRVAERTRELSSLLELYAAWRGLTRHRISASERLGTLPSYPAIAVFICALGLVSFVVRIWWPMGWFFQPLPGLEVAYLPQYLSLYILGLVASRRNWFVALSPGWPGTGR